MIKSRRMRWAGYVARMGEKMNAYRILVGNPDGNIFGLCLFVLLCSSNVCDIKNKLVSMEEPG
jgi:hypothetical protein